MQVELSDVAVTVAGRRLVEDITMRARPGEVVGLVGPNGSGKSSTLRCAFRTLRPSSGVVRLDGDDLSGMSLRTSARLVAALTQESQVEFDFTVAEVVAMGRTPHQHTFDRSSDEDRDVCADALHQVDCAHLTARSFLSLSGGEKQRVLIARALAQRPSLLVLDEPTNHLDIRHQLDVLALVRQLGPTVLTALHDLNLAAAYCDRLYLLDAGRIVADGPPREVLTPDLVHRVFGVRAHAVDHPVTGTLQLLYDPQPVGS